MPDFRPECQSKQPRRARRVTCVPGRRDAEVRVCVRARIVLCHVEGDCHWEQRIVCILVKRFLVFALWTP